ncbi:expressed unknown protein [Seminavis robusta]|uniref:Uncharacterized protein n=1 Tax=Seminavis robusta TaxID=568900 RepID=A0A9N8EIQ3_9STRA|nr:expressed unknown protein [Seminavis robusta]|eukprot:Sro1143_g245950.1 n/a (500) ;mRNA; f:11155-12867
MMCPKHVLLSLLVLLWTPSSSAQVSVDLSNSTGAATTTNTSTSTGSTNDPMATSPKPPAEVEVTVFNTQGIPYPAFRYFSWITLDANEQEDAGILGYTEGDWNIPGSALIELKAWSTVQAESDPSTGVATATTKQENPEMKTKFEAMVDLGFSDEWQWDCYVNHYVDYFWYEMEEEGFAIYWEGLGWSQGSWNGSLPAPASEESEWVDLTPAEQQAAVELCYLPETWSLLDIRFWDNNYAALSGVAVDDSNNTIGAQFDDGTSLSVVLPADNVKNLERPENRFYAWDSLPPDVVNTVEDLGYTEDTWSEVQEADIEKVKYDDLNETQKYGVDALGFGPKEVYDCWIHHYDSYSWEELYAAGVQSYWETLGWNATSWMGVHPPAKNLTNTRFEELNDDEQEAVQQLCFFAESWNRRAGFPDDFLLIPEDGVEITLAPGFAPKTDAPTTAPPPPPVIPNTTSPPVSRDGDSLTSAATGYWWTSTMWNCVAVVGSSGLLLAY